MSPVEWLLHLGLFVTGAVFFGVAALALLERAAGAGRRFLGPRHVLWALAAFAAFGFLERLYHWVRPH